MYAQPLTDRIAPIDRPAPATDHGAMRVEAAAKFSERLAKLSAETKAKAAGEVPAKPDAAKTRDADKTKDSKNPKAPQMSKEEIKKLTEQHQELRDAAAQLVGITFYAPMLAMSRDSTFKSDLFHGGQGEDAFASHLDTIITERLSAAKRHPLADTVYRFLARNMPADPANPVKEEKISTDPNDPNRKTPDPIRWSDGVRSDASVTGDQGVWHA